MRNDRVNARAGRDAGFGLTEALIACALTLVVVGAGLGALSGGLNLAGQTRVVSDANETMQAAMGLMVRDFIQTGQGLPTGGIPIPSGGTAQPMTRPAPVGAGLTFPAAWTALPAISPGGSLGPIVLGVATDLVTLMYADPTLALNQYPLAAIAADGSSLTVDVRTSLAGPDGIHVGDVILFTNALGNALQTVTSTDAAQTVFFAAGDGLNLNQRNAPQGTLLNLRSTPTTFPPTTATRVTVVSYYVDVVTDPTLPRLVRQVAAGQRLAVALGTENLQFTYDLVDGLTNPTNVETPVAPFSPNQIRKANIFLTARSLDPDPSSGQFFRNSMATEVGLRSLSFVDRYK